MDFGDLRATCCLNHFIQVEVCSDQYLPIRLDLSSERTRQALSKSGTIFVKKRTSYKNKVCSQTSQTSRKSTRAAMILKPFYFQLSGSSFFAGNYGVGKVKGRVSYHFTATSPLV